MSISGGMHRAVDRAAAVEATALQVFVKSSRQWAARPLDPGDVEKFREKLGIHGLGPYTMAHASYLINLASPDATAWERSVEAFVVEMDRCEQLGIPYLVVHPGSHVGAGEEPGLDRVVQALDHVLSRDSDTSAERVTVLLETTAGQGTNLGHRFDELGRVLDRVREADRVGVCFDTCHVLAAGYDFRDAASYRRTIGELDSAVGLERVKAFHLNDSRNGLGTRRDRHEHIGKGEVGLEGFRRILGDRRFRDVPMVLETPKGEDLAEDRENLSVLRGLV